MNQKQLVEILQYLGDELWEVTPCHPITSPIRLALLLAMGAPRIFIEKELAFLHKKLNVGRLNPGELEREN